MPALIVIAITILVTAGLFSVRGRVLPSSAEVTPTPLPASAPNPTTYRSQPTARPSSTPKPITPTPHSTANPQRPATSWDYPGSRKISAGVYESSDDTDTITDWYRAKINSLGYNIKTFVKTKANDKVLNKLAGARSTEEVSIEISKNSGDSVAQITLRIDNR